ncbi:adenylyl-sulfate kinase [Polyangium aurulentum]|uniref:adenylyl-sulfate kinase n=1 Tax=Polyangium aurulentum TaxID=2567896 RepID=UPI0010AE41A5|nr:adenylyl-sulfate kinase [Polyangium aurulentum]UQA63388.1 adenylyl-sulfate kinase [Polyangium aurulentum]
MTGFVVWFTGLSGAGKSTLAAMLGAELRARGVHVEVLDGDEVRTHLSKGLGFSREDRDTNVRRIGFVAKLLARAGSCAITAAISPYRSIRDEQRAQIGRFVEVHCACEIPALAERDAKGLYKKALAGEIKNFTGIDDPYEPPLSPEITVHTDRETKEQSLARIVARLEELGYVPRRGSALALSGTPGLVAPHGGELSVRLATGERGDRLADRARDLPVIELDAPAEMHLDLLATGALSPLKGFLTSKDFLRVAREMRLENGLPWPVPVTLPLAARDPSAVKIGAEAALRTRDGRLVAVIEVSDLFRPDELVSTRNAQSPLGDEDLAGVLGRAPSASVLVGGEVHVFDRPIGAEIPILPDEPAATRAMFSARGLSQIAALRTEALPRRAEEHLAKAALEVVGTLWIQALAGGGMPLELRLRCHEILLAKYFPTERVLLSTGAAVTRPAGLRENLMGALVAQNHGCSHAVVSAGAERAFRVYAPGEIGIVPLCLEDPFYSTVTGSMATARTAPGEASTRWTASEAEILAMLERQQRLPEELVRPEIAETLAAWWALERF